MSDIQPKSEVARLLRQIRDEFDSATLGLAGFASGTSQHQHIIQKMENMEKLHKELRNFVGDEAMGLVAQALEDAPETRHAYPQ